MKKSFFMIIGLLIMLINIFVASGVAPTDNLNIYFPFNHSGSTLPVDYGSDVNDNSLVNTDSFSVGFASYTSGSGVDGGNEISFNGDMPDSDIFRTGTDTGLTMVSGEDFSFCGIFEPQTTGADRMVFRQSSDTFNIYLDNSGTWYAQLNGNYVDTGSYTHSDDSKEHICLVFDNTANTFSIYSDGIYKSQKTGVSQEPIFTDKEMVFGTRDQWNREFNGTMQHVRLWLNKSLTQTEITDTYNADTNTEDEEDESSSGNLVLDLSFDNVTDCGNDNSGYHADFSEQGTADCISDLNICKWNNCLNLTSTSGDYLSGSTAFNLIDEITFVFWVYPTVSPDTSSQSYFDIGTDGTSNYLFSEESDYGFKSHWQMANGLLEENAGSSYTTPVGVWTHYAITYNGTNYVVYQNGVIIKNEILSLGNINYSNGATIKVGAGRYNIDVIGYLDEFQVYNSSLNISSVNVLYNEQKAGTPPDLDLIVKNISVDDSLNVMYDFSSSTNAINLSGTIPLTYVIENTGATNDSGSFNVTVYVNDVVICDDRTSLTKGSSESFTCQLTKSEAFISGYIKVDSYDEISESSFIGGSDNNNEFLIHYDMRAHPKIIPPINITYVSNSGNALAYNVYTTFLNFVSDNFNPSWGANSVDPRGKKGYENALSCMLSNYDAGDTACVYAWNHLDGWLINVSDWGEVADDVQAYHDTHFVAATYDIMFPNMTKVQADKYSVGLMNICTDLFGMNNVRPDLDDALVFAGNGKGFGSGMAYPCLAVLGEVDSNPSSYYVRDDFTTATSTVTGWLTRVDRHLMGGMNGSGMPEGYLYWNYALYHLVGLLYYDQQTDIMGITSSRQEDICGRGESLIYYYLDNTYNGQTIRGDQNNNARFLSFGDTHSYDDIGEMDIVGASLVTQLALLCDDADIKSALFSIRDLLRSDGSSAGQYRKPLDDIYFYELLEKSSSPMSQADLESKFFFEYEDAWGKAIFRDGYSYDDDTVVVVDGGDMPSFGHPNAEFDLFVYALGEPFLDQPQVPNEDDVRSERWHNTLSFSDSTANGYLSGDIICGYALNQYYGGATSPSVLDYPEGTYMSDACRGDTVDYFGYAGLVGGVKMTQPYFGASGVPTRKILMYDDVILDYYDVSRSVSGLIQFNWLNIYDEFTPSISSTNLGFNRVGTNKFYNLSVLDTTLSLSLSGGDSGVIASKRKTDTPNLNVNYSHYRHYGTGTSADTLFLHHWYDTTDTTTTTKVTSDDDIGVKIGSDVYLLMDVSGDGIVYNGIYTDGWSLIINSSHVGTNGATFIGNSSHNFSIPTTPFSGMVVASVDEDLVSPVISGLSVGSIGLGSARINFVTDEPGNSSVFYNNFNGSNGTVNTVSFGTTHSVLLSGLVADNLYNFTLSGVCDLSGNCASQETGSFNTLNNDVDLSSDGLADVLLPFVVILFLTSFLAYMWVFFSEEGFSDPKNTIILIVTTIFVILGAVIISTMI